jgi:predicted acylesterase/phospholipase RssA
VPSRFVAATSKITSDTVLFTSYPTNRWVTTPKIWEAARATSAASSFFDPIDIDGERFLDGATGANNPIDQTKAEAIHIFSNSTGGPWRLEDHLQCLVSIGTGIPELKSFGNDPLSIGASLVRIALDTESRAEQFQRNNVEVFKDGRAYRFNVIRGLEKIGLEEADKQNEIIACTKRYLASSDVLEKLERCGQRLRERGRLYSFL